MTDRDKRSFHIIFSIILVVLLATLETSLWPRVLSPIPNPQIWLSVVVFVFLYRSPTESMMIVYLPCLFVYLLTMQPLGYLLLAQTLLFFMVLSVRTRVFVPGQFYYSVMYASSVLVFHILMFLFAWIFETRPTSLSQILAWFIQSIIAFVISPLLYNLIKRITPIEEQIDAGEGGFL